MHTVAKCGESHRVPVLHTTGLRDGAADPSGAWVSSKHHARIVSGPAVFVPRVGRPDQRKIAVARSGRFVLSDCVFGMPCDSGAQAEALGAWLRAHFSELAAMYGGTGAPYLRRDKLVQLLGQCGLRRKAHAVAYECPVVPNPPLLSRRGTNGIQLA